MLLGSVLTPINEHNLRLAAQCGVDGIVARYPGPTLEALLAVQEVIGRHGMRVLAVEGYLPIEKIKLGTDHSGEEMAAMKNLLRNMAKAALGLS